MAVAGRRVTVTPVGPAGAPPPPARGPRCPARAAGRSASERAVRPPCFYEYSAAALLLQLYSYTMYYCGSGNTTV
eukprot:COSAG05_NODE_1382_length_5019_cov_58.408740_4_plen_75_part_00